MCLPYVWVHIDFKWHSIEELGLRAKTPVGTSLIDAHAGGAGVIKSMAVLDFETKGYDMLKFRGATSCLLKKRKMLRKGNFNCWRGESKSLSRKNRKPANKWGKHRRNFQRKMHKLMNGLMSIITACWMHLLAWILTAWKIWTGIISSRSLVWRCMQKALDQLVRHPPKGELWL